jgi:UDP-N-acetylmuramate dehydrogenase
VNAASAGCIWKNPKCDSCAGAGELIERLGLKGHSVGGAQVSPLHANFIVNTGHATGADVRKLMDDVEERVLKASGIRLEREVRLLGD